MSTDEVKTHQRYQFKPSRIALGFQLLCLTVIFIVLCSIITVWTSVLLLLLACFSLKIFRMRPEVRSLEHFDLEHWSLQYEDSNQIHHIQIQKMIDHQFYIAVYFCEESNKSLIIWQDQLSTIQWKSLKSRVTLS